MAYAAAYWRSKVEASPLCLESWVRLNKRLGGKVQKWRKLAVLRCFLSETLFEGERTNSELGRTGEDDPSLPSGGKAEGRGATIGEASVVATPGRFRLVRDGISRLGSCDRIAPTIFSIAAFASIARC